MSWMIRKNKIFLLSCCTILFVFVISLVLLVSFNRNRTTDKPVDMPRGADPAVQAQTKISEYKNPDAVVSVHELNTLLNDPRVVILDARCGNHKAYKINYIPEHIPGANPILRSSYTDPARDNRIAPPKQAQTLFRTGGFDNNARIILYGNDGLQGRVYWMMRMYGVENKIQILDGGLDKWKELKLNTESGKKGKPYSATGKFDFNPDKANPNYYTNLNEVSSLMGDPDTLFVDARTKEEYIGGHIPFSVNMSPEDIFNEDKTFKPMQELSVIASRIGITPDKTIIVYSNMGTRSSLLWVVLHELLGYENVKNYDGGFKEWSYRGREIDSGEQVPPAKQNS